MFARFIDRPILACVISLLVVVVGVVAAFSLPIAQYPAIAPPVINIQATYPGASAQQAYEAIAIPLEQQINGAPGLIYINSTSAANGSVDIDATFAVGSDLNAAAAEVLTRANLAQAQLPAAVTAQGLQITKSSRQQVGIIVLSSPHGEYDDLFLSNWAETQVIKPLRRVSGMGRIINYSQRRYAIRIWLDPVKMEALAITPETVLSAVRQQNTQITTGTLGQPPLGDPTVLELQIVTQGRFRKPDEFADILLRSNPDGSIVRIRDVGRVELGSEQYGVRAQYDGQPAATLGIYQVPGSNAVDVMNGARSTMEDLAKRFPPGMTYSVALDRTEFVKQSLIDVVEALGEAIALVVVVTFLFLQNWRATLIPAIAVPVALIGTFGPMKALGFSLNTLSLLGLVLAVGLVVDDAIIVVENTERLMEEGKTPSDAAREAINELAEPVIAIALVLAVLFVPVAFIPGLTGELYNQFALTIAISMLISAGVSLTLTPALAALLLKPKGDAPNRAWWRAPLRWLDAALATSAAFLVDAVGVLTRHLVLVGIGFAALAAATVVLVWQRPAAFVPQEDQGYFLADIAMPKGASVSRTQALNERLGKALHQVPAVAHTIGVSGRSILASASAPFYGFQVPIFKPWGDRDTTVNDVIARIRHDFGHAPEGTVRAINPSPLPGIGSHGGLTLEIQDRSGTGGVALAKAANDFIDELQQRPEIASAIPTTSYGVPEIRLDIDRTEAEQLGVPLQNLFDALATYVGSSFVNLFDRFGFVYQVYVQGEASARRTLSDIDALPVLNSQGQPVRMGSLVRPHFETGPTAVLSYNTYPAIEVAISVAGSASTGDVIALIEKLADRSLPRNYSVAWTEVAYQEKQASGYAPIIFGLGVLMVFLLLAGQYESIRLPFAVLLATPVAIFGAIGALALRSLPLDIFGQIGLLLLVGLAAKNSILLVSFAENLRQGGQDPLEAAQNAVRLRMRPVLMTSFAFILGSVPLAIASGAGANARISIGTVVIGGLLVATLITLFITPTFYVALERIFGSAPDGKAQAEGSEPRSDGREGDEHDDAKG